MTLLRAKLQAPAINKNTVIRERLMQKLCRLPEYKLTLITAPAGYGKTTAVLQWLARCNMPVAWLSLDKNDNSPGVFWQYVFLALSDIFTDLGKDTEYLFGSRELLQANLHISVLIDTLAGAESDFALVLDDLHEIDDAGILNGLSYLIDYLPPRMHLVVISRTVPALEYAKHKLKWQTQHLQENTLQFGEEEITSFFLARGIQLQDNDVRKVKSYTEGWAAALVAVAMSMEEGEERNVINALEASSKDIGQYLNDEVLSTWSEERRSFAVNTCILDTLSPAACDAVTGETDGERLINEIYRCNGFLMALDAEKKEYKYHYLFNRFLHRLLANLAPQEISRLYIRAGRWYAGRNSVPEAIEYLLEGGAYGEARDLVEYRIDDIIRKNDFSRVLPWAERLPEEYRDDSFKIAAIYALYHTENDRFDFARVCIDKAKALRVLDKYREVPGWENYSKSVCALLEVNYLLHKGSVDFVQLLASTENNRRKMSGYSDFNATDIYFYRCPIRAMAKLVGQGAGKFEEVIRSYRELISVNPGYGPLIAGEYYYENNRFGEAVPYLLKAVDEALAAACPGALVPAAVNLARISRAKGDWAEAVSVIAECERNLKALKKSHWLYTLAAFRCRLSIDRGNAAEVDAWLNESKPGLFQEVSKAREYELSVYCRALIYKERRGEARLLLQRMLAYASQFNRPHSETEILNLLALLDFKDNDMPEAVRRLEAALAIGLREGYVRSFLDEGYPMAVLLKYYISSGSRHAASCQTESYDTYARCLLKQMRAEPVTAIPQRAPRGSELLTPQEKRVLKLILKACSNKEICEKLGISIITVKNHTGNIYSKLGVQSRAQCIHLFQGQQTEELP